MAPQKGVTVATTDFPLYTIHMVGDSHFLVAGGGGQAKTGVPNAVEIYCLSPSDGSCIVTKVEHIELSPGPAMNGCVASDTDNKQIVSAFGIDSKCYTYRLRSKVVTKKSEENATGGVRKRKGNQSVEQKNTKLGSKILSYDMEPIGSVQTDFGPDGGYQRAVRFTSDLSLMVTGGADGKLRTWKFPDLEKLYEIKAHADEIDDIDISPPGNRIVTIGKDSKAFIWNTKDGSKKVELQWDCSKEAKYKFRACRFGEVLDKKETYRLYTANIPAVRAQKPLSCYITKWDTRKYVPTKSVKTGTDILSSFAVSDNGIYLAVGTMSGTVSVYISFSLQKLYHLSKVHNIFVTGLSFAHSTEKAMAITGNHDATLFSISADNQIKMHQVAAEKQISALVPILGFIFCIYLFYWIITTLGL